MTQVCTKCGKTVPVENLTQRNDGNWVCSSTSGIFTISNCTIDSAIRAVWGSRTRDLSTPVAEAARTIDAILDNIHERTENNTSREEIHAEERPEEIKVSLNKVMEKLDEHKESMTENAYLDLANALKEVWDKT